MAEIIRRSTQWYQYFFIDVVDPITKDWILVGKPYQVLTVLALYLTFVYKWGPEFMKNRQPFKIEKIMMVYNLFQVFACAYVLWEAVYYAWGTSYKWICQGVNYSNTSQALTERLVVNHYYMMKIIDLIDTVFFVLRKKFNQVSFLHVYHHTGMVLLCWGATTYFPGGHGTFIGVINSFVHVVMYFYYFLTVAVPSYKQSVWFKKHITQLQIFQFFWCVVHMAILVFQPDCPYPRWIAAIFLPQNLFMLLLFIDFYIKSYIKTPKTKLETQTKRNGHFHGPIVSEKSIRRNSFKNSKEKLH